jgi:hypothetical protein
MQRVVEPSRTRRQIQQLFLAAPGIGGIEHEGAVETGDNYLVNSFNGNETVQASD